MPDQNSTPAERIAVLSAIFPATVNTTVVESNRVNPVRMYRLRATITAGAVGSPITATLTKSSQTTGNTNATTSSIFTTLIGTGSSNSVTIIDWLSTKDYDTTYPYVSIQLSGGTNSTTVSALLEGFDDSLQPASNDNIAAVTIARN